MHRHPSSIAPQPGQESVWDYPRPPRLEPVAERLRVRFGGETIAETVNGYRVLETSHPPVYYFPLGDIRQDLLVKAAGMSLCEYKGAATYVTIMVGGKSSERAGWLYAAPT